MPSNRRDRDRLPPGGYDPRSIHRAWELHNSGIDLPDGVRAEIHQSWVRSTSAGIDPRCGEAPSAEDASEVEKLRQSNRELCRAARGSLDKIGRMLHGAEAMLILTDENGLVIEAIGDPKTLAAGRDINLHVGALWNEHAVGTNGIGTTLWAGEPMFVHGGEHYVEALKEWSCAAAPIRNPIDQSVIGAVDLSGLTKIFRHHNTAFAAAAAGEIQAALAQALNEERIRLLDALIEQGPVAGHEDGILILDRAGRVVHRSGFERLVLRRRHRARHPDRPAAGASRRGADARRGRLGAAQGLRLPRGQRPHASTASCAGVALRAAERPLHATRRPRRRSPPPGRGRCPEPGSSPRTCACSRRSTSRAASPGSTPRFWCRARPAPARSCSPA